MARAIRDEKRRSPFSVRIVLSEVCRDDSDETGTRLGFLNFRRTYVRICLISRHSEPVSCPALSFISLGDRHQAVWADNVNFKDCGSVSGVIQSVDVTPCPQEPCQFARNTTIKVAITYKANADITKATTKVYGIILGAKVPFPVPEDGCKDMACPVKQGTTVTYRNTVFVKTEYPHVSVVVQWEVHDQSGKNIVCFNVPVQITG
ncbi:hypothetical protein ACOMHN_051834 [Nucella lapillus]